MFLKVFKKCQRGQQQQHFATEHVGYLNAGHKAGAAEEAII
jgi:hypothetical protein